MDRVKPPLGRVLLRLFTVQGSWNYDRLIGIGMGVAEEPLLRDLRGRPDNGAAYRHAVARGAHFFNAHPYLCGLAVGAAARAEHDGTPPEQVERLRTTLCGPLGSLGDRLVWVGWLPLLSTAAIAAIALGFGGWAIIAFFVIYNVGHVTLRWWALRAGWTAGTSVVGALRHPVLQRSISVILPAMALVSGLCLPLATRWLALAVPARPALAFLGVAAVGLVVLRRWPRITGLRFGLLVIGIGLLIGVVWR
jgi:mannose/fructose/N-acetylgalactosamine-specific phosphotransferase system component IID